MRGDNRIGIGETMTALSDLLASLRASVGRDSFVGPSELLALAEIVQQMRVDMRMTELARDAALATVDDISAERDSAREETSALLKQVYKQTETIERLLGELESVTRERDEWRAKYGGAMGDVSEVQVERDAARASLAATEAALADSREKAQTWMERSAAFEKEVRDIRVVVERETVEAIAAWLDTTAHELDRGQNPYRPSERDDTRSDTYQDAASEIRAGAWRKP